MNENIKKAKAWFGDIKKEQERLRNLDSYCLDKLVEYSISLFKYSLFKEGDRIQLSDTPKITDEISYGWLGYKDRLIKGTLGTVLEIDHDYHGRIFTYGIKFDWDYHIFNFAENWLKKYEHKELLND